MIHTFRRFAFFLVVLLSLAVKPLTIWAQLTSPIPLQPSTSSSLTQDKSLMPPSGEVVSGSAVDPKEYYLGPGDALQCRFWTSGQSVYPVVTGDQLLVVPLLGAFDVRGKTLADLRDTVYKMADVVFADSKAKTGRSPLTLSLFQPRRVLVKVKGDVLYPSLYLLSATTRADIAVALANKATTESLGTDGIGKQEALSRQQREKQIESYFGGRDAIQPSQRYITIAHPDGSTQRLDLIRYEGMHDPIAAPLLRESDVVIVPVRDPSNGVIGVYGAVQSPGEFEFVEGDSLSTAIKYAFGPTANADAHHVELTRLAENGDAEPPSIVDLVAIEAHQSPDVRLQRFDRILVRGHHDSRSAAVVAVHGEVNQPGTFAINDGQTMLSQVVREAGGLTKEAYPASGYVLRHGRSGYMALGGSEDVNQRTLMENLGTSDTGSLRRQFMLRQPVVVVDMERALIRGEKSADITLRDGDEIVIPVKPTTVFVTGFVNNAGFVSYEAGASLDYYISHAGGYAIGATTGRTVVIKARSKAWLSPGDTKIEPGDEIFVPKEPDNPPGLETQNLAAIGSLVLSAASLLLSVYNAFIKK